MTFYVTRCYKSCFVTGLKNKSHNFCTKRGDRFAENSPGEGGSCAVGIIVLVCLEAMQISKWLPILHMWC